MKYFFAPNFPIFLIRLAEEREDEEHGQLQSVMLFTQKQYLVGPFNAGPKWCYFLCYDVGRTGLICLSMSLTMHISKILPNRASVEGTKVNRANKVIYSFVFYLTRAEIL